MFIIESAVHYRSRVTDSVNLGSMFSDEVRQETSRSHAKDIVVAAIIQEGSSLEGEIVDRRFLSRLLSPQSSVKGRQTPHRGHGISAVSLRTRVLLLSLQREKRSPCCSETLQRPSRPNLSTRGS